jgi:hypothetical protein
MHLKTEMNTLQMRTRVSRAFAESRGIIGREKAGVHAVFEHGQWWITLADGAQYSVVDAEGPKTIDGFDFEQVTRGNED